MTVEKVADSKAMLADSDDDLVMNSTALPKMHVMDNVYF